MEAYSQFLNGGYITPIPPIEKSPPYPKWYKPEARCAYHGGGAGHDIDNCFALKKRVQSLRDVGWVNFSSAPKAPNVGTNPLPEHLGDLANLSTEGGARILSASEVHMERRMLLEVLDERLS